MSAVAWWRIELDRNGAVVRCRRVDDRRTETATVIYVQAKDESSALKLGKREYRRIQMRIQRKRYAEEGRCNCGGIRMEGRAQCSTCVGRAERYNAKRTGRSAPPVRPKAERPVSKAQQRENIVEGLLLKARRERKFGTRLVVLEEVAEVWRRCETQAEFAKWLRSEIVKITGDDKTPGERSAVGSALGDAAGLG